MFTSQVVSQATSPITVRRGSSLVALVALIAAGVVALIIALVIGGSAGGASHSRTANPLPQVRDLAPAWNLGASAGPASTPTGTFRDPQTHALLNVRP